MEKFEIGVNSSFDSYIDQDELNSKIVCHLNSIFEKDIQNLYKAKKLVEDLTATQKALEEKLQFATSEAPDKIFKAIKAGEDTLNESKLLEAELDDINIVVKNYKDGIQPFINEITPNIRIVQKFKKVQVYQNWLGSIQELSEQIKTHLNLSSYNEALQCYQSLTESTRIIAQSHCAHLLKYCCQIVFYWYEILKKQLEGEVETILKAMKYPFTADPTIQSTVSMENVEKLQANLSHLIDLKIPSHLQEFSAKDETFSINNSHLDLRFPSLVGDFFVSLLPVQLLLKPFEIRFLFNFSGVRATNSRSNPEWYLTQVLKWITIHEAFLESNIQPILKKKGLQNVDVKIEFIMGLLRLVVMKLSIDLPEIQSDEDLFCLTVQETLNFERELRLGLGYPSNKPSVLNVLTRAAIFNRWIAIERKFALELMDEFISSPYAWQCEEETGVSHCGDQLILLLQGITDRYKPLPQPGHRLQFLDLQLELLDDFRVRVLQLTKGELLDVLKSNYCSILNNVHHIVTTLTDWSDLPFFIEMQYFREKFNVLHEDLKGKASLNNSSLLKARNEGINNFDPGIDDSFVSAVGVQGSETRQDAFTTLNLEYANPAGAELFEVTGSVFQDISDLYSHIEKEMLLMLTQHVVTEVRARSQAYRKDKWFVTPSEDPLATSNVFQISPSLCSFLEVLVRNLNLLHENLSPKLFENCWKSLASYLNKFIYEDVILENNFSEYGSAQLNYDMSKALFPVFGEYHSKPENFFPHIRESLILLTLPRPTALLLKDALKYSKSDRDSYNHQISPVKVLEERGVYTMSVQEAETVLNIRTNMAAI